MSQFGSMLGTRQAAPGRLQAGYFCTGTAVYHGSFLGTVALRPNGIQQTLGDGQLVTLVPVTGPVASQLATSDLDWWEFH